MHSEHLVCPHGSCKGFFGFFSEVCCALKSPCCRPGDFIDNGDFAEIFTNANFFVLIVFFHLSPLGYRYPPFVFVPGGTGKMRHKIWIWQC